MAKYSFELKKQIVLEYLSGNGSSDFWQRNIVFHKVKWFETG